MKTYTARSVITLAKGAVVQLSDKQARDRLPRMTRLADGRYRLNEDLQIKAGEIFGYEGELPKAVAIEVDTATTPVPHKKVAAAPEGKPGGKKKS